MQLQTLASPLRRHFDLLDDQDDDGDDAMAGREVIHGMVVGREFEIRSADGALRGPVMNDDDVDPGDVGIDSGFSYEHFNKGVVCFLFKLGCDVRNQAIEFLPTGGGVGGAAKFTHWQREIEH